MSAGFAFLRKTSRELRERNAPRAVTRVPRKEDELLGGFAVAGQEGERFARNAVVG